MTTTTPASHEALYRWKEMLLPVLIGTVVLCVAGIALGIMYIEDGNSFVAAILWMFGAVIVIVAVSTALAFRVHRWTIEPGGVLVEEWPKVPLAGFRRRLTVPFGDMAALSRVESGFDTLLELATRKGAVYRLPARATPNSKWTQKFHREELAAFASAIQGAAMQAGRPLPPMTEALSMWNKPFGLFIQVIMLLIALGFGGLAGLTLLDGGVDRPVTRLGEMYAIALLLPFGAAYLLYRSLKRRREVLRGLQVLKGP